MLAAAGTGPALLTAPSGYRHLYTPFCPSIQGSQLLGLLWNMQPWALHLPSGRGTEPTAGTSPVIAHRLDNESNDKLPHRPGVCPAKRWGAVLDSGEVVGWGG